MDNISVADIVCSWTSDPSQLSKRSESGETQVFVGPEGVIQNAKIILLTLPITSLRAVSDNLIRLVSLHEVGHALGLLGHSQNPADVMFFSEPLTDERKELSTRDSKTIVRLYSRK